MEDLGSCGACPRTRTTTWIFDSPTSRFPFEASLEAEDADRDEGCDDAPLTVSRLAAAEDETGGATLGALERGWTGRVSCEDEGWRRSDDELDISAK